MSYLGSPFYLSHQDQDEYDFKDDKYDTLEDMEDDNYYAQQNNQIDGSDEDTEEASETDMATTEEPLEIKEQMYQDKLSSLKKQLAQLKDGSHVELNRRYKRLEAQYKERLRQNDVSRDYMMECVERDYILEKTAAAKEFEEKKIDLKENLLTDFEDKRKLIESERHSMELTGDSMEVKPVMTRKLRRRPNDPMPVPEKRRKPPTAQLVLLLEEKDVEGDMKVISRGKILTPVRKPVVHTPHSPVAAVVEHTSPTVETRIEDGKLLYERRWFHRGQPVYVEGKDTARFSANISAIGNDIIWVKKPDGSKFKIYTSQLSRGKMSIKRRAS